MLNISNKNSLKVLERIIVVGVSLLLLASLYHYLQIHIWQHDSAYYDLKGLFHKIFKEGRWLNPYLVSVLVKLDGRLVLLSGLVCLFSYFYLCAYAYTKQRAYAYVFSVLCLLSPPITDNLMWPAVTMPALGILLLSFFAIRVLPIWLFYAIFGALFFSTLSNFYYLLPLAHLAKLRNEEPFLSILLIIKKVLLPWASGFIIGFLVMKTAIYAFSWNAFGEGSTALNIAEWRQPNPVKNLDDFLQNTQKSLSALISHLSIFFQSPLSLLIAFAALFIRFIKSDVSENLLLAIVGIAMAIAHYLIIIPVGINFDLRTATATWIGIYAVLFLVDSLSVIRKQLLMMLMFMLSLGWYLDTKSSLNAHHAVTTHYYHDLLMEIPSDYQSFETIIVLSPSQSYAALNAKIIKHYNLNRDRLVWVDGLFGWSPIAYEAGFEKVVLCENYYSYDDICVEARERFPAQSTPSSIGQTTVVEGFFDGKLVVRFNPDAIIE